MNQYGNVEIQLSARRKVGTDHNYYRKKILLKTYAKIKDWGFKSTVLTKILFYFRWPIHYNWSIFFSAEFEKKR